MSKVLIIGIDSMDSVLLSKFENEMPNFKKIKESSPDIKFNSVFPPDSPTCWASIYTGLNPAKHGILFFMDPLEKMGKSIKDELDNSSVKGRTFWDIAGGFNKKVYIFHPLLGYPAWDINGIMVGRATAKSDVQMKPLLESEKKLMELDNLKGLPGRDPMKFIDYGKKLINKEIEFSLKYIKKDWDLFFVYSSVLDPIQHNFWNSFDKTDYTYEEGNKYETVIKEFYIEYDKLVGRFLNSIDSDTTIVILSDHGHMRRPVNIVNINRILKEKGYFAQNQSNKSIKIDIYKKRAFIMDAITKLRLGELAIKIIGLFPSAKSIFTSPDFINWNDTIAYVSDLSGIKAYTYGGIIIRKDKLKQQSYEDALNDIIKILFDLKHPATGESLMKWVKKRNELYEGEFIEKYPDIIFEFQEDYGAGWSFEDSLITLCDSHNIQPGSHRQDTPILLMANLNGKNPTRQNITLMDVAPTILDILEINGSFDYDGKSIFKN